MQNKKTLIHTNTTFFLNYSLEKSILDRILQLFLLICFVFVMFLPTFSICCGWPSIKIKIWELVIFGFSPNNTEFLVQLRNLSKFVRILVLYAIFNLNYYKKWGLFAWILVFFFILVAIQSQISTFFWCKSGVLKSFFWYLLDFILTISFERKNNVLVVIKHLDQCKTRKL